MVRLLRLTPYVLIVLAAVEGSVAHLGHDDHCDHGGGVAARDGFDAHPNPEFDGSRCSLWAAAVPADGDCPACAYLAQRAGVNTPTNTVQFSSAVEAMRCPSPRGDEAGVTGVHRARAPPRLG